MYLECIKHILEALLFMSCSGIQLGNSRPRTGASGPKAFFAHKCNNSDANNQDASISCGSWVQEFSWYKFCSSEPFLKRTISFQSGNPGKATWSQPLNRDVSGFFIHRESYQCSHLTACCKPLPVDICDTQSVLTREHCRIQ